MSSFVSLDRDLEDADAGIEGYVVDARAEQVPNWLGGSLDAELTGRVVEVLRGMGDVRVAIVRNIWVAEESRGRGLASELLDAALDDAYADVVLLVCDTGESQAEGFVLQDFYERHDFEAALPTGAGPLMVYPPEVAQAIRACLCVQPPAAPGR